MSLLNFLQREQVSSPRDQHRGVAEMRRKVSCIDDTPTNQQSPSSNCNLGHLLDINIWEAPNSGSKALTKVNSLGPSPRL
jgi:hypothetical protein